MSEETATEKAKGGGEASSEFDTTFSGYELLGFSAVEPMGREAIIPFDERFKPALTWAATDCDRSQWTFARAKPRRPLSAKFFEKLELIRRVAMSEAAKAGASQEILAIIGIVMDREMIVLAAEDANLPPTDMARVLAARPGSFAELAAFIQGRSGQSQVTQPRPTRAQSPQSKGRGVCCIDFLVQLVQNIFTTNITYTYLSLVYL